MSQCCSLHSLLSPFLHKLDMAWQPQGLLVLSYLYLPEYFCSSDFCGLSTHAPFSMLSSEGMCTVSTVHVKRMSLAAALPLLGLPIHDVISYSRAGFLTDLFWFWLVPSRQSLSNLDASPLRMRCCMALSFDSCLFCVLPDCLLFLLLTRLSV